MTQFVEWLLTTSDDPISNSPILVRHFDLLLSFEKTKINKKEAREWPLTIQPW